MRFLFSRRWVLFALAVVALAFLAYRLGEWQFHRLDDRVAKNAVTKENLRAEPIPVDRALTVGEPVPEQLEWRQVTATGRYDESETLIIRYQTRGGSSGVDVVTPLVTGSGNAVLVDRGWMPTDNAGMTDVDVPAAPQGQVTVVGWVRGNATGDAARVSQQSARSISSAQIAPTVPFPVYGGWVDAETESPKPAEPLARAEPPDLSEGPHFFYGLQWWFFAALAVFGFCYLAWDERRKSRAPVHEPPVEQMSGSP